MLSPVANATGANFFLAELYVQYIDRNMLPITVKVLYTHLLEKWEKNRHIDNPINCTSCDKPTTSSSITLEVRSSLTWSYAIA